MREVNYHDLKAFLWYMGDEDMVKQVLFNMTTREAEQMFEDMETLYQHLNLDKVPQQYAEKGRAATLRITETLYYMIKEGIIKSI